MQKNRAQNTVYRPVQIVYKRKKYVKAAHIAYPACMLFITWNKTLR